MKTDELIVQLASAARPVTPLPAPAVRLARWSAAAIAAGASGALVIGLRPDIVLAMHRTMFMSTAALAVATALLAAAAAFVLSVPGAERSAIQRRIPLLIGVLWAFVWLAALMGERDPLQRITTMPIHVACPLEIAVFGVLAGWPLFAMLRRAAPMHRLWTAVLAALAATALGAAATQFVCPIDDPAHQLLQHVLSVALFSLCAAAWSVRRKYFR